MKHLITIFFALLLIACSTSSVTGNEPEAEPELDNSPVSVHGQLSIKNGTMVNFKNQPVQLKGMSLFWSQWMPQY